MHLTLFHANSRRAGCFKLQTTRLSSDAFAVRQSPNRILPYYAFYSVHPLLSFVRNAGLSQEKNKMAEVQVIYTSFSAI